jgi:hypothetical protein
MTNLMERAIARHRGQRVCHAGGVLVPGGGRTALRLGDGWHDDCAPAGAQFLCYEGPSIRPHAWAPQQHEHDRGHCQLNEKSLTDAFLMRKTDGVQVAKTKAIVKEEDQR